MNDPKDPKNLPPDDFSKTTPYIRPSKQDSSSAPKDDYTSDWEKTNFNFAPSPPRSSAPEEDWGKTAATQSPRNNNQQQEIRKNLCREMPQQPQSLVRLGYDAGNIGGKEDFGRVAEAVRFGLDHAYINLPKAERANTKNRSVRPGATKEDNPAGKKPRLGLGWFGGVALCFSSRATIIGAIMFLEKKRLRRSVNARSRKAKFRRRHALGLHSEGLFGFGLTAGSPKSNQASECPSWRADKREDGAKTSKSCQKQAEQMSRRRTMRELKKGDFANQEKMRHRRAR